jgi:hypothetical protein
MKNWNGKRREMEAEDLRQPASVGSLSQMDELNTILDQGGTMGGPRWRN